MANETTQTRRYFLQGDRDAAGPAFEALLALVTLLVAAGSGINLGAYGAIPKGIVQALAGKLVNGMIRCHLFKSVADRPEWTQNIDTVDCFQLAAQIGQACMDVAYGILWGVIRDSSAGYVFLPGSDGTRMHLDLAVRWQKKVPSDKRIVLLGWSDADLLSLAIGTGVTVADIGNEWPSWIQPFRLDQVDEAAAYLLGA